jgi:DnaA family protein
LRQLALDIGLSPAPDFDTFIALGNEPVLTELSSMRPGCAPVYLWGPSGSGKTHLLKALQAHAQRRGERVLWLEPGGIWPHAETGTAGPSNASLIDPLDVQWLLMDQAEAWSAAEQQAAFSAFVRVGAQGGCVVAAGRMPPVDLPIREDIRTRLGWGLVLSLWPLGESTLRQALQDEAQRRGLRLGDEVLDYALKRLARDLKSLTGLLDRLDRYALQWQRPLTVPLLRQMLDEEQSPP